VRMSIPAYFTLGLLTLMVIISFAANPEPGFLLVTIPGILILFGIPLILNEMNRRHMDKIDFRDFKLYRIKDLERLKVGDPVRLRGTVKKVSLKWLNRPNFRIDDGSGEIGVFLFWAPREDIKAGDRVEAAGSLRSGLNRQKNVWGIKIEKVER